jgi:hypothetical protein
LPVAPGQFGKVRVEIKGRAEDFVANVVEDAGSLPAGATVLIVAEGARRSPSRPRRCTRKVRRYGIA